MLDPLAYTIPAALDAIGCGRTYLYQEIKSGRLEVRKMGSKTLILADELRRYLAALPAVQPQEQAHRPVYHRRTRPVRRVAR